MENNRINQEYPLFVLREELRTQANEVTVRLQRSVGRRPPATGSPVWSTVRRSSTSASWQSGSSTCSTAGTHWSSASTGKRWSSATAGETAPSASPDSSGSDLQGYGSADSFPRDIKKTG